MVVVILRVLGQEFAFDFQLLNYQGPQLPNSLLVFASGFRRVLLFVLVRDIAERPQAGGLQHSVLLLRF
jgi:hypothetical protein